MTPQKVTPYLNRAGRRRLAKEPKPSAFSSCREEWSPSINDRAGRRVRRTLPDGVVYETFQYDATGNVTEHRTLNANTISYGIHPQTDRITSKTMSPGGVVSFEYDTAGRRAVMNDATGAVTFNYDSRDRLVRKISPWGTVQYGYDRSGNLTGMGTLNAEGVTVSYIRDGLSRPVTVVDERMPLGSRETVYTYDGVGNLDKCTYPNGVRHDWDYNVQNHLTALTVTNGANILKSFNYTLGPTGNRQSVVENAGRSVTWVYDDLYRLTGETITNAAVNGTISYTYDRVGNRLTRGSNIVAVPTQTFTGNYDVNDKLNAAGYSYDTGGRTTASNGWTYAYDAENRLISASQGTTQLTYAYDGDGNRVQKILAVNGQTPVTTRYLVDTNNLTGYAQVLEELDGNNVVKKRYTYGLDLISQTDVATSVSHYYGYDGTGSVRFLTDSTGAISDSYDYEAFGQILSSTGSTNNEFKFHGERQDPEMGLTYLRARYMDGNIGRFTTMDSYEGDANNPLTQHKYVYVSGNPVNKSDPSGLDPQWGSRISELMRWGFMYHATLIAQSIVERNYTDKANCHYGMTGKQVFTWIEGGKAISGSAKGVIWATGYMKNEGPKDYEYPTIPGLFPIVPSDPGSTYPIAIDNPEGGIRFHRGFHSAGCIVYGRSEVGRTIEARILENFKRNVQMHAQLTVVDKRRSDEKKKRPLPY